MTFRFILTALLLVIIFLLAQGFLYFKFKRNSSFTDLHKSLWLILLFSVLCAAILVAVGLLLPITVDISPAIDDGSPFHNLVRNQRRIRNELSDLSQILIVISTVLILYLGGLSTLIGRVWQHWQKPVSENDSSVKKTVGLE